jgi:hypothetical protein
MYLKLMYITNTQSVDRLSGQFFISYAIHSMEKVKLVIAKIVRTKLTYDLVVLHCQITYGLFVPEKRKKLSGGSDGAVVGMRAGRRICGTRR